MPAKHDKYIDLNQFPHKNGHISWQDSIGKVFYFYFDNEQHTLKIVEKVKSEYFKIIIDDNYIINSINGGNLIRLRFSNVLNNLKHKYEIGQVVNGLTIKGFSGKKYFCKCNLDGYEFDVLESDLNRSYGCPVCSGHRVIKGINDIATTDPDLIKYFADINDAYTHTRCSNQSVNVICPICGSCKTMTVNNLTNRRFVSCDICSDGISYPNKFAHELFKQLKEQYLYYEYEYNPEWASPYLYDNYIILMNGEKIIVEMDGHYHNNSDEQKIRDKEKDILADSNNIKVVRINCCYSDIRDRFDFIKGNVIETLVKYFDLSNIDWDICGEKALESKIISVINEYNNNLKVTIPDIAKNNNISLTTVYNYLHIGNNIGLCHYIKKDRNRIKNSKPFAVYDLNKNLIGIFKSPHQIFEMFPEKNFSKSGIRNAISKENHIYKGYYFEPSSYEEYINY